ncbi:MAG: DUF445 family protein [Thermodesulfobacteriota bacterium]
MPFDPHVLAPPLIGAFIGYLTNDIAIRMLFRPLRPWRLLGMRLPLTPGVIPAKRHELARNIGAMVGDHLLTSKDVQKGIMAPAFQEELAALVRDRVESLLDRQLGPLPSLVPERFRPYFDAGVKILDRRAQKSLQTYLAGDDFRKAMRGAAADALQGFLGRGWEDFLKEKDETALLDFFEEMSGKMLASGRLAAWVRLAVRESFEQAVADGRTLQDLLGEEMVAMLGKELRGALPGLLTKLAGALGRSELRHAFTDKLVAALQSFIASLGPMAALIGGFVSAEKLAAHIDAYLEAHWQELSTGLTDGETGRQLTALLNDKLEEFFRLPIARLLPVDGEKRQLIPDKLAEAILLQLRRPQAANGLRNMLADHLAALHGRSLAEGCRDLFGGERTGRGLAWLTGEWVSLVQSSAFRHFAAELASSLLHSKLLHRPLGSLREFLPGAVREGLHLYLVQQINDLLLREVPGLVDSLNIRDLVTRKVDTLDLLRLEGLLMGIMKEQFKYINLFGGLLGFLIGLVNLLVLF